MKKDTKEDYGNIVLGLIESRKEAVVKYRNAKAKRDMATIEIGGLNKSTKDCQNIVDDIDMEIKEYKHRLEMLERRFNERDLERLLYRSLLCLDNIKRRGIGLDSSEEKLSDDIKKQLDGVDYRP